MKFFILLTTVFLVSVSAENCTKESSKKTYKGRLEIAGICMNYTIRVLEGNIDTSLIVADWTDDVTGNPYQNVFKLGSPCTFPATIKQGDEFYFVIDSSQAQNCAVCLAYYPTPKKSLPVKIVTP